MMWWFETGSDWKEDGVLFLDSLLEAKVLWWLHPQLSMGELNSMLPTDSFMFNVVLMSLTQTNQSGGRFRRKPSVNKENMLNNSEWIPTSLSSGDLLVQSCSLCSEALIKQERNSSSIYLSTHRSIWHVCILERVCLRWLELGHFYLFKCFTVSPPNLLFKLRSHI